MKRSAAVLVALRDGKPHMISNGGITYVVDYVDKEWEEKEHWWSSRCRKFYRLLTNRAVLIISEFEDEWHLSSISELLEDE